MALGREKCTLHSSGQDYKYLGLVLICLHCKGVPCIKHLASGQLIQMINSYLKKKG